MRYLYFRTFWAARHVRRLRRRPDPRDPRAVDHDRRVADQSELTLPQGRGVGDELSDAGDQCAAHVLLQFHRAG